MNRKMREEEKEEGGREKKRKEKTCHYYTGAVGASKNVMDFISIICSICCTNKRKEF